MELMFSLRQQHSAKDEMREAFRIFDQDGDGFIDAEDIGRTMEELGEKLTADDVQQMVREADADGNGKINFEGQCLCSDFMKQISEVLFMDELSFLF